MAVSKQEGGFDCKFVEKPVSYLQSECPVCLLILREPYQVTCCGKSFCRVCIERVKADNKPCPCCNRKNFNDFANLGLQQPLYGFKVYCSNKGDGCEWTGELRQLDKHLNLNPDQTEALLEGCALARIKCQHCFEYFMRTKLHNHQANLCDQRPSCCIYCNSYKSTYKDVVYNHWPVCECYPVQCPNECGESLQRRNLKEHFSTDCPLTVVNCDLHYAGCMVKLPRKNMPAHLREDFISHFSLLAVSLKEQQRENQTLRRKVHDMEQQQKELQEQHSHIKQQQKDLQQQHKDLQEEHSCMKEILQLGDYYPPCDVHCPYPALRQTHYSHPFYSHFLGYTFKYSMTKVDLNVVQIHVTLTKGVNHHLEQWPVSCSVTILILNQEDHVNHYTMVADLSLQIQKQVYGRSVLDSRKPIVQSDGFKFSAHEFEKKYIKQGHVTFRITEIAIKNRQ